METKKTQIKRKFVSLAEARPDLAKEWNYEKNGDLRPEDVSCGSNKRSGGFSMIKARLQVR